MKEKDDTHRRWQSQSTEELSIWDKYNQVVAPKIIRNALSKSCHVKELYQVLSVARLRCEFEKSAQTNKVSFAEQTSFGALQPGCSIEPDIMGEYWGEFVKRLYKERNNPMGACGLSKFYFDPDYELFVHHPKGYILEKVDFIFQQLMTTNNFFEFTQYAAHMTYLLSNFPPITRGSAAVNSWIIDGVARERFNLSDSLRPLLYDWTAFFETPEQYTTFYVISVVTNYIQTIPLIYQEHKEFFDSIPELMLKDPSIPENLQERKKIWTTIQGYVGEALETGQLTLEQNNYLRAVKQGSLTFREPSLAMSLLANALRNTVNEEITLDELLHTIGYPMERLKKLIHFRYNAAEAYLTAPNEEEVAIDWADSALLRTCPKKLLMQLIGEEPTAPTEFNVESVCSAIVLSSDPRGLNQDQLKIKLNNKPAIVLYGKEVYYIDTDWQPILINSFCLNSYKKLIDEYHLVLDELREDVITLYDFDLDLNYRPTRFSKEVETFRRLSFATWEDIREVPVEILTLLTAIKESDNPEIKDLERNLQEAIWSGGVRIQDLAHLNLEQIKLISSPSAIALYQENTFICARDLLAPAASDLSDEKETERPRAPIGRYQPIFWQREEGESEVSSALASNMSKDNLPK